MPSALITGASRGLGAAIAQEIESTHHILLGGRDAAALHPLVDHLPDAEPWVADLTDFDAVTAAAESIDELSVLVHNAGRATIGRVDSTPLSEWKTMFDLNLFAAVHLTQQLLPALRKAGGHVVFINSGAGLRVNEQWSAYAASKFALKAFADGLRVEEPGLRVTSIFPGRIDTDMQRSIVACEGQEYDPDRFLKPATVARAVGHAIRTPEDAHPTDVILRPFNK
ncbi:SDR family oxidoreductase [Hoyosella rhizosphaerae]|uniref:Short chain dehydrogenase n=1 Tax=Hoyosella rhizosphaerae TaxID=1755582 RepID=A0A916U885_9ACTN|nr:SDR family oxidoreductase [Hoyosella rhizosphaerae]MBN4927506.1 SDR family oxidoreductase [Hoyosella rhizosphaerae]GGC63955.1 short chain dehydrogenase [Hoyosella rhizosphaerae]